MKRPHLALAISINICTIPIKPEQHLHMKAQKVDCISLPGELQDLTTRQVHRWNRNPCVSDKSNWLKLAELAVPAGKTNFPLNVCCMQMANIERSPATTQNGATYRTTSLHTVLPQPYSALDRPHSFPPNTFFWLICFAVVKKYARDPASDVTQLGNKTSGISDKHSN